MTETPDLLALRDGLPEGPWTFHHGVRPGAYIPEWWVEGTTGRFLVAKVDSKPLARAIAAIPSMLEEIERSRATNVGQKLHRQACEIASLRALVENKNEACLLAIADVERLHGHLRYLLGLVENGHVTPEVDASLNEIRAILTKTETTP